MSADTPDERSKKAMEDLTKLLRASWFDEDQEEKYVPLEQDEQGIYGYKVLYRTKFAPWFVSPNRRTEWIRNEIASHISPDRGKDTYDKCGIYATKDLESLREWYLSYERQMNALNTHFGNHTKMYVVKILAWGIVVEHTKGFRTQYAKIIEVLGE